MKLTYTKGNRKITINNCKELMAQKSWFKNNGLMREFGTVLNDMAEQEMAERAGDIASDLAQKVVNRFLDLTKNFYNLRGAERVADSVTIYEDLKLEKNLRNETLQAVTLEIAIEHQKLLKLTDHYMFTECVINQLMDHDILTEYPDNNKIDKILETLS